MRILKKLKIFARYLVDKRRAVLKYDYQNGKDLNVWVDSDFAGCTKTRKSTSGGVLMFGNHVIKTWSTTQAVIALSSGETEYYSLVKGASVSMGIKALINELNPDTHVRMRIRIKTDASAAKGIAARRGIGKVRHIEVTQLWVQEKVQKGVIEVEKVRTGDNIADAMTKYVEREIVEKHCNGCGLCIRTTRHEVMPEK